jgi:hypothetical protein
MAFESLHYGDFFKFLSSAAAAGHLIPASKG